MAVLGLTVGGAWLYEVPKRLNIAAARGVAQAGFEVRDVEVRGLHHMSRLPVYTAALDGASDSMLLVDLDVVRERLRLLPWVADASVGRKLPDTLVIDIVERSPAAIWQYGGRHALVDAEGHVLVTRRLTQFAHLPVVVGKGANTEVGALARLLQDYPAVAKHVGGAVRVGERRWDLKLAGGETLALPEGDAAARKALDTFVRMDRDNGLLGKGFVRFDMRLPDRMTVRMASNDGKEPMIAGTEI
jgi:cell division protein FtsQ